MLFDVVISHTAAKRPIDN